MSTAAILGKGTILYQEDTPGSNTHTAINEVGTITGPTTEADEVDVTSQEEVGKFRSFIAGLTDPGEITFDINYIPVADATHALLDTAMGTGAVYEWVINVPTAGDPGTISAHMIFDGFVKTFSKTFPIDSQIKADCTIRIAGLVTVATGAGNLP